MKLKELLAVEVGDVRLLYRLDEESGAVELALYPAGFAPAPMAEERQKLSQLAEVHIRGDEASGMHSSGRTMRYGGSSRSFRFKSIEQLDHEIITVLADLRGYELTHRLRWFEDRPVFVVDTEFYNASPLPVTLDFITSFTLGSIAGYIEGVPEERLRLHRYRAVWSSEAFPVADAVEDLLLTHTWGGAPVAVAERFGQVGTMPVRGFHPFAAVEDAETGVFWGAQLAWTGSWQLELTRHRADALALDGGLADREFGHWSKVIAPGERFTAPEAFVSCCRGSLDELCQRLLEIPERRLNLPSSEEELPVIFNEWCSSWGDPREEALLAIADRLSGTPVKYLVIDAGWYKEKGREWYQIQGDWVVNPELFPDGIGKTVERIRERGLIPGIWFEAEVCGEGSRAFTETEALQLTRDGLPICAGRRHFLDLRKEEAQERLDKKVVTFLKNNGFGYLKIDYNETVGIGCDHPDSLGEGLRLQVEGVHRFFRRLREVNPELVVENCASGGGRLEPVMFTLSSMSSFSDAHAEPEIPVIAANLHNLMLPRQCQIWAVLNPAAPMTQLRYVLGGAMLGRMCLSGKVMELSEEQWGVVKEAMAFYEELKPVLKEGFSRYYPQASRPRRHLRGSQVLLRMGRGGDEGILYFFAFDQAPQELRAELPPGTWKAAGSFGDGAFTIKEGQCRFAPAAPMSCRIIRIVK